jgi:microcystin degradation protein MlrC
MRIALGQLWQETNTFNPQPTTRADFEQFGVTRGAEMLSKMAQTNELGGMIQSLAHWNEPPECVGLVRLPAWPSGLATAETYNWIEQEFLAALAAAGPLDGVLLALHGSLAADQHPDVEGELLAAIRSCVGPIPIVATLDLHAHVTPAMIEAADALVLFHTIPHVDVVSTGARGARVLERILYEGAKPKMAWQPVPVVLPAELANSELAGNVAADRKARLLEMERDLRVLAAGVATVQPWLDVPGLCSAAVVVTDGDDSLAAQFCDELSGSLWNRRQDYLPALVELPAAIRQAFEAPAGLTVLSDGSDATTSGAPGDSVWFVEEALHYDWPRPALLALTDPETVLQAEHLGAGKSASFRLGGKRDTRFGKQIEQEFVVERCFDAQFTLTGHLGTNLPIDMGRAALLRRGNVQLVVTTRTGPHFAPELFRAAGLDPFTAQLVVAKSPCGFRAVYTQRASSILNVRSPGCAAPDFWTYPYHNLPRPCWPWDEFGWVPQARLKS